MCLSVFSDPLFVLCASPIFVTSGVDLTPGKSLTFEVFEANAAELRSRLGEIERYTLDSSSSFFAQLTTLEPCESAHSALSYLRNEPTLRGVLTIQPPPTIQ